MKQFFNIFVKCMHLKCFGTWDFVASSCAHSFTIWNPSANLKLIHSFLNKVPPRWIVEPTDKAFAQGSEAKIECKADGFPKPQISWKKAPGKSKIEGRFKKSMESNEQQHEYLTGSTPNDYRDIRSNNYVRIEDGTLSIGNIQKSSEGYYLCEASNGIGAGLSAVIFVSVQGNWFSDSCFLKFIFLTKTLSCSPSSIWNQIQKSNCSSRRTGRPSVWS